MQNLDYLLIPEKSKIGSNWYNIPKHQTFHHNEKLFCDKLPPSVSVSDKPHTSGTNIDFDIEDFWDNVFDDLIYSFTITENNTSAVNLIAGPLMIDLLQVLCAGKTLCEYDSMLLYILNCLNVDNGSSEKYILSSSGVNNDFVSTVALSQNSSKEYYINLYSILSNLSFNKESLKSKITVRIKFKKTIESAGKDAQLTFSNINLFFLGHSISEKLRYSICCETDYKLNAFQKFNYNLVNGVSSGVKQSISLQGVENEVSLFLFYVKKKNDSVANSCATIPISSFYIEFPKKKNSDTTDNIEYDTDFLKYILNAKLFKGTTFFNNQNIYLFTYAYDPQKTVYNNKHMAHEKFKNCKLHFIPSSTEAGACEFILYYMTPAILRVLKNKMELVYDYY